MDFPWPDDLLEAFAYLTDRGIWIRAGTFIVGVWMVIFGIIYLMKGTFTGVAGGIVKGALK